LLAQVLCEEDEYRKGKAHLSLAKRLIRRSGSSMLQYMALIKEAQFSWQNGEEATGLDSLAQAMALGKKNGYTKLFPWWQPSIIAGLCARALQAGIEVDYVQEMIREHELVPAEPPRGVEDWPWPVKIYTLGRF
jgi:LuxR family maltose regulon positive regulatory protein